MALPDGGHPTVIVATAGDEFQRAASNGDAREYQRSADDFHGRQPLVEYDRGDYRRGGGRQQERG